MPRPTLLAAALAALAAAPALAQRPEYDANRHVLVITSPLDSADVANALLAALRGEGLEVEQSDTARGRIFTVRRPSDSFGSTGGSVVYAAMVRRMPGGGSQVFMGGIIKANPNNRAGSDPDRFARRADPNEAREGADAFFLRPGSSGEWRRLERIANEVQRAGTPR